MKYSKIALISLFALVVISASINAQLMSVEIEDIQLKELYAAEYRAYMREPIGTLMISNPSNEELWATVILNGDRYINAPVKMTAKLPAGLRSQVLLYIDLDIGVLDLNRQIEHIPISIDLVAHLGETEVFHADEITRNIALNDRHKIPEGNPAKIAIFVDPNDRYIASEVSSGIDSNIAEEKKALAAFEFLGKKGIYCIGPGGTQVQYPRELLRTKLGSVYDGSLLYVTVLEQLGVKTKLIFNNDTMLPLYRYEDNWYPVDMNMLGDSFSRARSSGDRLQEVMQSGRSETVVLHEAWKEYSPLWFPVLSSEDMPLFQSAGKHIEERNLEDAVKIFDQLLGKYPNNPVLLNNAANVELLMGKHKKAVDRYALAVNRAPDDGGLYLNMGIAYHRMGDEGKSLEFIRKAHTKLGSYTAMHNMLNLDENDGAYGEIDGLLRKASQESSVISIALAARSMAKSQYPLYWKRFHK